MVLGKVSNEEIVGILKNSYSDERKKRIEEEILRKHLLTYKDYVRYLEGGILWERQAAKIITEIEKYNLGVEFILGGIDEDEACIHDIANPGTSTCLNSMGYHAIGSGRIYAIQIFIGYDYDMEFPLKKALFITYEAKKNAEKGFGVGEYTDVHIISKKANKIFPLSNDDIKKLNRIYEDRNRIKQQQNEEIFEKMKKLKLNVK